MIEDEGDSAFYDGDGDIPLLPRRSRPKRFFIGVAFITVAAISTTVAANITLNGGAKKEFGQGLYVIKACDQWVSIGLGTQASATGGTVSVANGGSGIARNAGDLKIKEMIINGLDTKLCKGTNIKIQLWSGSNNVPMPIFHDDSGDVSRVILNVPSNAVTATIADRGNNLNFINGYGQVIGSSQNWDDGSELLDWNSNSPGTYILWFTTPLGWAQDFTRLTLESASN